MSELSRRLVENVEELYQIDRFRPVIEKFILGLSFADRLQLLNNSHVQGIVDLITDNFSDEEKEAEEKATRAAMEAREKAEKKASQGF